MKKFKHINHGFVFEELEATTTEDGRTYRVPFYDGQYIDYPSVTTVLGFDKKEFFEEWRKLGINRRISKKAIDRGNIIHDSIENYLNNKEDAFDVENVDHKSILSIMKSSLNNIDNIRALEVPLYSHEMCIAGRVDCVAEYDGVLSIIDFKGSDKLKKEEWIENYFMQATAYSIMWQELTGQAIDDLVIIIGTETGICQVYKKKVSDYVPRLSRHLIKYDEYTQKESVEKT